MVLERHGDIVAATRKSIDRIGYEEGLHDFDDDGGRASVEGDLNRCIETPFSNSPTWLKISGGNCATLDAMDRFALYGFARHLQLRNYGMLQFIESQHARFLAGQLDDELTDEERAMHRWLAVSSGAPRELFRAGAMATLLPSDADTISVMVCQSPVPLRTSTNPTIVVSHPGRRSVFGPMFDSLRTWWLTLDRFWGTFIIAGGPPGFSNGPIDADVARVINRRQLVQFLNGGARYLLADDPLIGADLEWAGFAFTRRTTHGSRYRAADPA